MTDSDLFDRSELMIGVHFWTETGEWVVTDIGTRTVIACKFENGYPSATDKPPYFSAEFVFDEDDREALYRRQVED